MKHWTEIRTAASVVKTGNVTISAELLKLHRTTVVRHIDTLEKELGGKLFQRHARGFSPTSLGHHLLRIASASEHHFNELFILSTADNQSVSGEFRLTTVDAYESILLKKLKGCDKVFPMLTIEIVSTDTILQLQYGEADLAFRIGDSPLAQDNVSVPFEQLSYGVYAHKDLLNSIGWAEDEPSFFSLPFAGPTVNTPLAPFMKWIEENTHKLNITITADSILSLFQSVISGVTAGFLPTTIANNYSDLTCILSPDDKWIEQVWLISHVDVYRSNRVQKVVEFLKKAEHVENS